MEWDSFEEHISTQRFRVIRILPGHTHVGIRSHSRWRSLGQTFGLDYSRSTKLPMNQMRNSITQPKFVGELTMNVLHGPFMKTIVLLAAILLPVQQSLPATCCCDGGRHEGKQNAVAQKGHSPKRQHSCCQQAKNPKQSCCQNSHRGSGPKPCRCPHGCAAKLKPQAVEHSSRTRIASPNELFGIVALPVIFGPRRLNPILIVAWRTCHIFLRGAQLCVLYCRFTL